MIDKITQWIRIITILCLIALFIYGAFWIFKTVSYYLFYEDMVRRTVVDMVDSNILNEL